MIWMPPRKLDVEQLRVRVYFIDRLGRRRFAESAEARLKAKLTGMDDPDACWVWSGFTNSNGYGVMSIQGGIALVHRLAYAFHVGSDPAELVICHACDNPPCCNPAHLFAGTQEDNIKDMAHKGRGRSGKTKLSDAEVLEIRKRRANGESVLSLAAAFNVSRTHILRIVNNQRRRRVRAPRLGVA